MATQRPLKEGSVRTYQEKVGLGFVDILASEMDADLDTIYAAWNGRDTSPTGAAGGRLTGSYPNPGLAADVEQTVLGNFDQHTVGGILLKPSGTAVTVGLIDNSGTSAELGINHPWGPQDPAKSSWLLVQAIDSADQVTWYHRAAGAPAGTVTTPLQVLGNGIVTAGKFIRPVAEAGSIANTEGAHAYGTGTQPVLMTTTWVDPGNLTPDSVGNSQVFAPGYANTFGIIFGRISFTPAAAGFGVGLQMEQYNGSAWEVIAYTATAAAAFLNLTACVPITTTTNLFRLQLTNATGGTITIPASGARLVVASLGRW